MPSGPLRNFHAAGRGGKTVCSIRERPSRKQKRLGGPLFLQTNFACNPSFFAGSVVEDAHASV